MHGYDLGCLGAFWRPLSLSTAYPVEMHVLWQSRNNLCDRFVRNLWSRLHPFLWLSAKAQPDFPSFPPCRVASRPQRETQKHNRSRVHTNSESFTPSSARTRQDTRAYRQPDRKRRNVGVCVCVCAQKPSTSAPSDPSTRPSSTCRNTKQGHSSSRSTRSQ